MSPTPALFLMGPTAAGKTGLAMRLADRFPVHLVSVDSGQVYRGMDIGTAKLSEAEMAAYPHALIDIRDPANPYSADDFCRDALAQMEIAVSKNRIPLLVGGTMFYFRSLQYGLPDLPSANDEVRQALIEEAEQKGWPTLYKRLQKMDPESALRIDSNDRQRIQRALEILELTGIPASQHKPHGPQDFPYDIIKLGVWPGDRAILHARIEQRLEKMFEQGFLEEVKRLHARKGLHDKLPAMRAVGYRQIMDYLNGEVDYDTMRERCIFATRQLAKRQLTWLRNDPDVVWFDTEDVDFEGNVLEFLQKTTSVGQYIT